MPLELVPKDAPSYDGSRLCFLDKEHFVHLCGALLKVISARTGKTVGFVSSPVPCTRGISAYGTSSKGKVVAIARRTVPPAIDVIAWPGRGAGSDEGMPPFNAKKLGRERRVVATGGAGLEYTAVALSRRGERLAAVSGVADSVLTVWDLPQGRDAGIKDAATGAVAQATLCASVELPCACDTVSFNPSNPGMVMCTAASHHHDGVGGGHAGGCFVFKLSTSHGHTSLSIVHFDLASLPFPWEPGSGDAKAVNGAGFGGTNDDGEGNSPGDRTPRSDGEEGSAERRESNFSQANNGKEGEDEEDDEARALKGHATHAHGRLSVGAAVWGPGDMVYVGTHAGVVGRFDGATGGLQRAWAKGTGQGLPPSPVVGLVLTKSYLCVASRARMIYWLATDTMESVEHTATIFGISNSTPPERVASLAASTDYRYLVASTFEGTIHSCAVEPPAEAGMRSKQTGFPEIMPILTDTHDGFILCAAGLAVPYGHSGPEGLVASAEVWVTGATDGQVRVWWGADCSCAGARTFRSEKPPAKSDGDFAGSNRSRSSSGSESSGSEGSEEESLGALQEGSNEDEIELDAAAAAEETDNATSMTAGGVEEDPLTLPIVPVTSLAAMPGQPLLAVGLADGQVAILLLRAEHVASGADGADSGGEAGNAPAAAHVAAAPAPAAAANPFKKKAAFGVSAAAPAQLTSPTGAGPGKAAGDADFPPKDVHLLLLALDVKQLGRKPVTHFAFSSPGHAHGRAPDAVLLAVANSAEGLVHIIEMAPPEVIIVPESDSGAAPGPAVRACSLFRVVARIECAPPEDGADEFDGFASFEDAPSHHHHHHHHHGLAGKRITSLCWTDAEVLVVATLDGCLTAYAVPPPPGPGQWYSPEEVASNPLQPLSQVAFPAETLGGAGTASGRAGAMAQTSASASEHKHDTHHHHHPKHNGGMGGLASPHQYGMGGPPPPPVLVLLAVPSPAAFGQDHGSGAVSGAPSGFVATGLEGGGLFAATPAVPFPALLRCAPKGSAGWVAALTEVADPAQGDNKVVTLSPHPNNLPSASSGGKRSKSGNKEGGGVVLSTVDRPDGGGSLVRAEDSHGASCHQQAAGEGAFAALSHARGHARGVGCAALAPLGIGGSSAGSSAGQLAVTGGVDGKLVLWALGGAGKATMMRVAEIQAHASAVLAVCFSPGGTHVLSADMDRTVLVTRVAGLGSPAPVAFGTSTPHATAVTDHLKERRGSSQGGSDRRGSFGGSGSGHNTPFTAAALLRRARGLDLEEYRLRQVADRAEAHRASGRSSSALSSIALVNRRSCARSHALVFDPFNLAEDAPADASLDRPLPAAGEFPTWCEQALKGDLPATGAAPENEGRDFSVDSDGGASNAFQMVPQAERREVAGGGLKRGPGKDDSKVLSLGRRLEALLDANDVASDLERLERDAFVVDVARRDATVAANEARAFAVKASLLEEDAVQDLVSSRLRVKAHHSMEVHSVEVCSLLNPEKLAVSNLPLPKPSQDGARLLDCAKRLRMVERLAMRLAVTTSADVARQAAEASLVRPKGVSAAKHAAAARLEGNAAYAAVLAALDRGDGAWPGVRAEVPDGVDWVVNEGLLVAEEDVVGKILAAEAPPPEAKKKKKGDDDGDGGDGGKDKGKAAAGHDDDSDDDDHTAKAGAAVEALPELPPLNAADVKTYLYPPTALRTTGQRRLQVLFLGELARALRKGFNKHLDKLAATKQDEVDKIEERNARIREIAGLLGLAPEASGAFAVIRSAHEFPDECLDVAESEMSQGPYETEAMKAAKAAAEAEKLRREEEARANNIGERALMDMMNGTLETAKAGALEATLAPMPDWMAELVAKGEGEQGVGRMTRDQKEEYDAYKETASAFEAAKAEERKALTEEVEKLKAEVGEVAAAFDVKVAKLRSLRVAAQQAVAVQELYASRLALGLMEGEALRVAMEGLEAKLHVLAGQKEDLDEQADRWHAMVDDAKARLEELVEQNDRIEKGARRELNAVASQPLSNDHARLLLGLIKSRRALADGGGSPAKGPRKTTLLAKKASSAGGDAGRRPSMGAKLMGAASSMIGARLKQKNSMGGGGLMGLLKSANNETELLRLAAAADPFASLNDGDADQAASVASGTSGAANEPGAKAKLELEAAIADASQPLSEEAELPEGMVVEPVVWEKLNEVRALKIRAEFEAKAQARAVSEMRKATEAIDRRDRAIAEAVARVASQIAALEGQMAANASDFELLVSAAQGQNEMVGADGMATPYSVMVAAQEQQLRQRLKEQARQDKADGRKAAVRGQRNVSGASALSSGGSVQAGPSVVTSSPSNRHNRHSDVMMVEGSAGADALGGSFVLGGNADMLPLLTPDLRGAVLVSNAVVEGLNEAIKEVGGEKIRAMQRIKQFRKSINLMVWEDGYDSMRLADLASFYTDVLLMRVEKTTLSVMRGESKMLDDAEAQQRQDARLATIDRVAAARQQQVEAQCAGLQRAIADRRSENGTLRDQLKALEGSVGAREAIYRARVESAGGDVSAATAAAGRMKRITMRRRLVDLARAQSEEVDFLRGELDRLRQRTFPSFAHAARSRLALPPDEAF